MAQACGSSSVKEHITTIATIGIDLDENTFHLVGLDWRGAIVLQLKRSRSQLERRLAGSSRGATSALQWPVAFTGWHES